MSLLSILKKFAFKLERQNDSVFSYPIDKQREIIRCFKEPENNIERAYNQYRCQMRLNKRYISFILNLASLPMMLLYLFKANDSIKNDAHFDAVFLAEGKPNHIIPNALKNEFKTWKRVEEHGQMLLSDDKAFFKSVLKEYPFSWHFLLKSLIKLRMYRYEIQSHNPKAIVVCGEYSFTSSLLTEYCNNLGLEHINVMHGEKLYYMRDSFFCFNRCYVWDEFYKKLFTELRAEPNQFIICVPRSMHFSEGRNVEKTFDYTYYLGAETGEVLVRVADALKLLVNKGSRVAIRPHPRYSDFEEIKNKFDGIVIENCEEIDIEQSVLRTKNVISLYSTVMNQAYHNNVGIVIDDVSNPSKYEKLNELKYVMMNVQHRTLSEVIGEKYDVADKKLISITTENLNTEIKNIMID